MCWNLFSVFCVELRRNAFISLFVTFKSFSFMPQTNKSSKLKLIRWKIKRGERKLLGKASFWERLFFSKERSFISNGYILGR